VLVSGWLVAVSVARRQYVATLRESISQHRVDVEQASAPVLDRSTTDLMATNLSASDPKDILYALSLFEMEQQRAAHPGIRALLRHSAPEVRQKAIAILSAAGDKAAVPEIQGLLRDPELSVRHRSPAFSQPPWTYRSSDGHRATWRFPRLLGPVGSRRLSGAARRGSETWKPRGISWTRWSTKEEKKVCVTAWKLPGCLASCRTVSIRCFQAACRFDTQVVCEAIRSVGMLHKRRLVPELLDRLGDHRLAASAAQALGRFGDTIVEDYATTSVIPPFLFQARREIPSVLVALGTSAAAGVLLDKPPCKAIRCCAFARFAALNKLCRLNPAIALDAQMLETVLAAEILGTLRSYQILATIGASQDSADPLARALKEAMQQELERIFLCSAAASPP